MQLCLRWIVTGIVLALMGSTTGRALAQTDDDRARQHFEAGTQFYNGRQWPEALREFRASYELSHRAVLLVNIATAHERMLDFVAAATALREYLALAPDADNRADIEGRLREYESHGAGSGTYQESIVWLQVVGLSVFGVGYIGGIVGPAAGGAPGEIIGLSCIPVAGPIVNLVNSSTDAAIGGFAGALTVQVVGLAAFLVGTFVLETHTRAPGPQVFVVPTITPNETGLSALGVF